MDIFLEALLAMSCTTVTQLGYTGKAYPSQSIDQQESHPIDMEIVLKCY